MSETNYRLGRVFGGDEAEARRRLERFEAQAVDMDMIDPARTASDYPAQRTTLAAAVSATGPGTFFRRAQRTLTFQPSREPGWWIERADQPDALPIRVAIENVWTTGAIVSNIVLRSGSPHNYLRMVEHIIALKAGLGLDDVVVRVDSGDPPLFDEGSMDLVRAVERAGIVKRDDVADYVTVTEPVTLLGARDEFLTFYPATNGSRRLTLDCAIDFPNAIGRQRLRYAMTPEAFSKGAVARTNTNLWTMLYCRSVGKVFADVRNLGYSNKNLLIAGPKRYVNLPRLVQNGKSLEAVWHRSALDLLAAVALIGGRFAGHVVSYKAGHALDCRLVTKLYQQRLLQAVSG